MQFITGLFGGSGNTVLTVIFALGIVLVLIVLVVWVLKLLFGASATAVRGRNRRLAVVDTLVVDQKRQLVIIRRDDVEHLLLVGGPQDLVVEAGIPVEEAPVAAPVRRPLPKVQAPLRRPVQAPPPAAPAVAVEALREPQAAPRSARSLRHTGLLRPVDQTEPKVAGHNLDNPAEAPVDSGKQGPSAELSEGFRLDQDTNSPANRN